MARNPLPQSRKRLMVDVVQPRIGTSYLETVRQYGAIVDFRLDDPASQGYVLDTAPRSTFMRLSPVFAGVAFQTGLTAPYVGSNAGVVRPSLQFQGTGALFGWPDSPIWDALEQPFSWNLWVYPGTTQVAFAEPFGTLYFDGTTFWGFMLEQSGTANSNAYHWHVSTQNGFARTGDVGLIANSWQMITCVWDGRVAQLYVNGIPRWFSAALPVGSVPQYRGNVGFMLGAANQANWGNQLWNGYMSDVSLFPRALNSHEIYNLYSAGVTPRAQPHRRILASGDAPQLGQTIPYDGFMGPWQIFNLTGWWAPETIVSGGANGSPVSQWNSLTSTLQNLAQANAAKQPTLALGAAPGGRDAVALNGASQWLDTVQAYAQSPMPTSYSLFAVLKPTAGITTAALLGAGDSTDGTSTGQRLAFGANGTGAIYGASGANANAYFLGGQPTGSAWGIAMHRLRTNSDYDYGWNGRVISFTAPAQAAVATTQNRVLRVGSQYTNLVSGNPPSPWSGQVAEILIYSRAVTEDERLQIEAYLMWKYWRRKPVGTVAGGTAQFGASQFGATQFGA